MLRDNFKPNKNIVVLLFRLRIIQDTLLFFVLLLTPAFLGWEDSLENGLATHSSILGLPW